jgi:hypothetical protein
MIISVSRRSDILSFYGEWFEKSLNKGFVEVSNPFNPKQKRVVSLKREDVDGFVFWTRNALPSLHLLEEIENRRYPYYVMITFTNYPKVIENNVPDFDLALKNFELLSKLLTPERVVWRYDPIFISNLTDIEFHKKNFLNIATVLSPFTKRVIVSLFDRYNCVLKRLQKVDEIKEREIERDSILSLLDYFCEVSKKHSFEIQSCCEEIFFKESKIKSGSCIDIHLFNKLFSLNLQYRKDKYQRKKCLCHQSVDIGKYNTCKGKCIYCYAVKS